MFELVDLYKKMYLIRSAEECIIRHYHEDRYSCPMHMSRGSEHIAVGVVSALKPDDMVFSTYRSHAPYLAKTDDLEGFMAEMRGDESGCCKGIGGSMHLCNPEKGFMGSSAIVASNIPVAVGAAMANKYQNNGKVVACFFGDGATNEGVFWESLNFACLHELPIIFVCEDNGLAVHTEKDVRQKYDLRKMLDSLMCNHCTVSEPDVDHVLRAAILFRDEIDPPHSWMPKFIICKYHRFLEHVGVNEDYDVGYRSKPDDWEKLDPVLVAEKMLGDVEQIKREIDGRVEACG